MRSLKCQLDTFCTSLLRGKQLVPDADNRQIPNFPFGAEPEPFKSSLYSTTVALMMKAVSTSESSVNLYQTTQQNISEDTIFACYRVYKSTLRSTTFTWNNFPCTYYLTTYRQKKKLLAICSGIYSV